MVAITTKATAPRSTWGGGWRGRMACALALCALLATAAAADPSPALTPQFRSVPVPRAVAASLMQDARGLIWVGTGNGLASWDGHRLQPLEREGRTAGERSLGWVRALAAAPDGRLWIGSEVDGLLVHEPATGRVRTLGADGGGRPATVLALVAEADGVWMGSLGGGLQHYRPAQGFQRIGTPDARVLALQRDPEGALWIGHWQGLARLSVGARVAEPLLRTESPVTALLALPDGSLWVGRQDGALGRLPAGATEVRWLNSAPSAAGPPGTVSALQLDAKGQLWVGRSRGGLELRDAASGTLLQHLRASRRPHGGLAGEQITALLRDAGGAMWVAGLGLGLQRQADSAALQLRGPDDEGPLQRLDARALLARPSELLVASHDGPLLRFDTHLRLLGEQARPGRAAVQALAEDREGRLWLADDAVLHCQQRDGSACGRWPLPGGHVNRLRPLRDGSLWIAGQEGLYVLRPGTDAAPRRVLDAEGQPLIGEAFAVVEAEAGSEAFWAGTVQGLWRGRFGSLRLQRVAEAPGEGLASPIVIGLLSTRDGRLWLDTSVGGLHRLLGMDAQGRARFDRISERLGSAGRPFGANLQEDARGRIWTQAFVYEPETDRLEELREAEALALGTPWFFAEAALPDGRLVFGGSRGLLVLQPALHGAGRRAPPLLATALRVEGSARALPAPGQPLELPPLSRGFSLEFAALDYAAPERLRYRYRLEGHDPDWVETDAGRRLASYGTLPPGAYRLRVQASSGPGQWDAPELQLPVHVAAAWWQQPWAKGLLVLAALLAVRSWTGWRTRQLRLREAELQAQVAERTQALHDAALTDPLTGLKNRRYLMQRIDGDLRLNERRASTAPPAEDLIVFLLDLDHFKLLNDSLGHAAGDAALQQTAERLRSVFRDSDMLLRWGGEEFLVVAQGSRREAAAELAERLRRALADAPMLLGPGLLMRQVTASIGFAVYPPDLDAPQAWSWDQLLQLADAALYAAKAAGRNTWVGVRAAPGVAPGSVPQGAAGAAVLEQAGLRVERPRK